MLFTGFIVAKAPTGGTFTINGSQQLSVSAADPIKAFSIRFLMFLPAYFETFL